MPGLFWLILGASMGYLVGAASMYCVLATMKKLDETS